MSCGPRILDGCDVGPGCWMDVMTGAPVVGWLFIVMYSKGLLINTSRHCGRQHSFVMSRKEGGWSEAWEGGGGGGGENLNVNT